MIKKTITYTDFDGNERTEDHYFNLSRAEILDLEMTTKGGYKSMIDRLVQTQDPTEMYPQFKKIVLMAYGEKSPDGKRFVKNQELRDSFEQTEAFSELMMSFFQNETNAVDFFGGIIPKVPEDHRPATPARASQE